MRNRIAKLAVLGLTGLTLFAAGLFGIGAGPKTVSAAEEYPGAWVKDPEYEGYPAEYQIDTNPDHYTFMVSKPVQNHIAGKTKEEERNQWYKEHVIFATDRDGSRNLYVTVVDAQGRKGTTQKLDWNSSKNGRLEVTYEGTFSNKKYTTASVNANHVLAILDSTMVVKNMDGIAYITGYFDNQEEMRNVAFNYYNRYYYEETARQYANKTFYHNGAFRLFSLDQANIDNLMKTIGDPIPKRTSQTTYYIGRIRNEYGKVKETVELGKFTQSGLDGQFYHVPDVKDYSADEWQFVEFKGKVEGKIGDGYHKGDVVITVPQTGYLVKYIVTDDDGTVTEEIYRDVTLPAEGFIGNDTETEDGITYRIIYRKTDLKVGDSSGIWPDEAYKINGKVVGASVVIGNPELGLATDAFYYYEKIVPDEPEEFDVPTEGKTINLTKPLRVRNIAHDFIPSVPDVDFTYRIAYERNTNAYLSQLNAAGTAYAADDIFSRYKPVGMGEDSQATVFEIWRGPIGGIEITEAVQFRHTDAFDSGSNDTVTKQIEVKVSGGTGASSQYFKRPGVYRYPIEEVTMREVDYSETDMYAANVTGNDKNGNRIVELDRDVQTDITVVENKQLRYLDVYVEWDSQENGFVVKDAVLHDIDSDLDYKKLNEKDKLFSEKEQDSDNYKSDEVSNLEQKGTKKTGFSESLYTTYDLVIGKEIMGKGLTNYDINDRLFKFKVTIAGPAYMEIGVNQTVNGARGDSRFAGSEAIPVNGVWEKTFEIKQNDYILLSGLPSGVTYEVEEINNEKDSAVGQPDTLDIFETYNTNRDDLERIIEADSTSLLNQHSERNVRMMEMQGAYFQIVSNSELTDEEKEESLKTVGLVKQLHTDKAPTPKVIGKREAYESVNNVFFLNVRYDNVVTGVAMSVAPYALMVAAAVIGVGGFLIVKKRRDADLDED